MSLIKEKFKNLHFGLKIFAVLLCFAMFVLLTEKVIEKFKQKITTTGLNWIDHFHGEINRKSKISFVNNEDIFQLWNGLAFWCSHHVTAVKLILPGLRHKLYDGESKHLPCFTFCPISAFKKRGLHYTSGTFLLHF